MPKIIAESNHVVSDVVEVRVMSDVDVEGYYLLYVFCCGNSALSTLFFYPSRISKYVLASYLGKRAKVVHFDDRKVAVLIKAK